MELTTIVGAVAGVASMTSFVPQVVKVLRTRDTSSISAGMYVVTVTAFILWVAYGVMLGELPIIVPNGVCLILSAAILGMKLLSRPAKEAVADTLEPVVGREQA